MASIDTGQFGKVLEPGLKKEFGKVCEDLYVSTSTAKATKEECEELLRTYGGLSLPAGTPVYYSSVPLPGLGTHPSSTVEQEGFIKGKTGFNHYGIEFQFDRNSSTSAIITAKFCDQGIAKIAQNTELGVVEACREMVNTIQWMYPEHKTMVDAIQQRQKDNNDCPF